MASFADFEAATRMRDLVKTLVREEMEATRPNYVYATVASIDRNSKRCTVIFPDSADPIPVQMGSIQPQDVGQTVRVEGNAGDRYISDVLGPALIGNQTVEGTVTSVSTSGSSADVSRDDGGGTINCRNGLGDMLKVNDRVVIQRFRDGSSTQNLRWWVTQRSTITSAPWNGAVGLAPGNTITQSTNAYYNLYAGPYSSGYRIPASGAGIMQVVLCGRLTDIGQQEIQVYPWNHLIMPGGGTSWAWRNEDIRTVTNAAGFARFTMVCDFAAFLSKGDIWTPQIRVECGGGIPSIIVNNVSGSFLWVSDDSREFDPA